MSAQWPTQLPDCLTMQSYGETIESAVIATAMDAGPDFRRKRPTVQPQPIHGSIVVTDDQLATFVTFFRSTLAGGVKPFDWKHPVTGDNCTMYFDGKPTVKPLGAKVFRVSLNLKIKA